VTSPPSVSTPESKPAPEPLLRVQALVNTRDIDQGTDALDGAEDAQDWLRSARLLGERTRLTAPDLDLVRRFRESIRVLLEQNAGRPPPSPAYLSVLADLARDVPQRLSVDKYGQIAFASGTTSDLRQSLGDLLLVIRDAQADGTWARLKACGNPGCRWAFYDRSHSRRGAWCDMTSCGNKIKNRNLRARKSAGSAVSAVTRS
jgi:predicted RNA-binding Zn ribbon-like protein